MDKQERAKVLDGIEKVVKLNAAGFVVKALNVRTNSFDWFYGELAIGQDQDMEEHFKLCRGGDRIDWPSFREWLLIRRPSPKPLGAPIAPEHREYLENLSKEASERVDDWPSPFLIRRAELKEYWAERGIQGAGEAFNSASLEDRAMSLAEFTSRFAPYGGDRHLANMCEAVMSLPSADEIAARVSATLPPSK
jgi:hypothetical protein